jgi:hypothetical protein
MLIDLSRHGNVTNAQIKKYDYLQVLFSIMIFCCPCGTFSNQEISVDIYNEIIFHLI